jgi:hypothetical protein
MKIKEIIILLFACVISGVAIGISLTRILP